MEILLVKKKKDATLGEGNVLIEKSTNGNVRSIVWVIEVLQ
jgi:hypothetical protein